MFFFLRHEACPFSETAGQTKSCPRSISWSNSYPGRSAATPSTGKGLPTFLALVRFFSCVDTLMHLHARWEGKLTSPTHLAFVRFFSCVDNFMALQVRFLRKSLSTNITLVSFLSHVHTFVLFHVTLVKSLLTLLVLLRFSSFVHMLVSAEVMFLSKSLPTCFTPVMFLSCMHQLVCLLVASSWNHLVTKLV